MIFIEEIQDGVPYDEDGARLAKYLSDEDIPYQLIKKEVIKFLDHKVERHLFVGSIPFMKECFFFYNITKYTLPVNCMRTGKRVTASDFKSLIKYSDESFFVKPTQDNLKEFDGFVCDKYTLSILDKYHSFVIYYPVFEKEISSEWRFFISDGKIVGSRNYGGDDCVYPSVNYIKYLIRRLEFIFPKNYCIDVAVFDDGTNDVVEFTDMWSVGSYGLDPKIYFRCLKNRFHELKIK